MKSINSDLKVIKRNVGIQSIIQTKEYVAPKVAYQHNLETVEYPKIVAIPHSLISLAIICSLIFYLSRFSTGIFEEDAKRGVVGCILCAFAFGCMYFPDSLLRRPHPIFWRLITTCALIYLLFITFILFQNVDEAKKFLTFFDKNLNKPMPEKNYADNCGLTQPDFPYLKLDAFYISLDFYMTAHLLGWYVKMLIVRDVKLCWFLSIFFEILEITFRHWLPNFWECWWDQVILDIFGMNALGIWLGDITCKYFEMKNYQWIEKSDSDIKTENPPKKKIPGKLYTFLHYFTPNYWVKHEWDIFSSVKRFYSVLWFIIFMNMVDISHFFLKYILWIPPTHYILALRIYMWGLLAIISAREYYEYITNDSCKRLGLNVWIAHLIVFIEWSSIIKFSNGILDQPFPQYVIIFWTMVFVLISGITIHLGIKDFMNYYSKKSDNKQVNFFEPEIEIEEITNFE
jgi:phosphatidylserine synthase 2